jgi:hypothetical protein
VLRAPRRARSEGPDAPRTARAAWGDRTTAKAGTGRRHEELCEVSGRARPLSDLVISQRASVQLWATSTTMRSGRA